MPVFCKALKMRTTVVGFVAVAFSALVLSGCGSRMGAVVATARPSPSILAVPPAPGAQRFAPLDQDPLVVQNAQGTFHITAAVGTQPHELLFFYAMQAAQRGIPQVAAWTSGTPRDGKVYSSPLVVNSVQPLGPLAEFDTGVIHLAWDDQFGANIVLAVTPPGSTTVAWQITLIDPQAVIPYNGTWWNWGFTGPLPAIGQVEMACPCGSDGFRLALLGRSPRAVPPLYVQIDRAGQVSLLSEAAWTALWPAGAVGDPAVPTEDLEHPFIAPTYPPTPTGGPSAPTVPPPLPPPPPTAGPAGPLPTPVPVPGVPAIAPTRKETGPDMPAFTADDVRRYHAAANPDGSFGMRAESTGPVRLEQITFLQEGELNKQHPDLEISGNATRLLCYVEYSGTFTVTGPSGSAARQAVHHAVEVYDAHTGNLLLSGVGP